MGAFDGNEQSIHDALSQISVDANKLAGQVKSRLHGETPCAAAPRRVRWAISAAAAIALSAVLVVTATAAALGGFDWFIEKFNPSFGEIVEPVEVYCEDQGIRMEVIGAQKYENMAIVYLSLRDISGQNRLTERTDFRDGFSVTMNPRAQGAAGQADEVIAAGVAWKQKLLYFDQKTNTVYYEFNITADSNSPLSDPLELGSFLIYFDEKDYANEPISISLSDPDKAEFIPIREDQIWGGMNMPDDRRNLTEALTPGYYAAMPHGEDDQWVSNVGILDGKLHVQTGKIFGKEFGSSDMMLSLIAPDGELIACDYKLTFFGDGDNRLLDLKENDYDDAVYKYEESVFSVNVEKLDGYTLCFTGSVYSGVKGRWKVAANPSDTSRQMRIWTNDIPVEGYLFEHIILSPLGLQVIGTYEGEECITSEMSLAVETVNGIIPLDGGSGSQNAEKHTFNSSWQTKTPLDVTTVTAVIIDGTRIPVK